MKILPVEILEAGPGIDLSNLPEGVSIRMSDPVEDFKYARNVVTLVFDLAGHEHVRLAFEAMEYGDEPHSPPAGPFGDDADFDGVAVSPDGVDWYEVQDLRHLRSDRFTDYDIDLDAAIAALGLAYGSEFRIRFCQYDNNPAPMDGIFVHGIELQGDLRPPILHLAMDDNAANPTVLDASAGAQDQTFLDPGGNPNTDAHSVPGVVGTALAFDGVDDAIDISGLAIPIDQDCAIALWYRLDALPTETLRSFGNYLWHESGMFLQQETDGRVRWQVMYNGGIYQFLMYVVVEHEWNHVVCQRNAGVIEFYVNAELVATYSDNPVQLLNGEVFFIGANIYKGEVAFSMDDFRVYDRALLEEEIQALFNMRD